MFGLSAFNRLLRARQQQQERPVLNASDALSAKQLKAGIKALRLLKLHKSLEALNREEMMDFLFAVGMNPTPDVLEGKLRLLRLHKQHAFTWGELAHVWSMLLHDAANEDQILERAFAFFDKDGNGEISVSELRTTMSELGDLLTEEEICAFIAIMDVDNDGVIGYQEFLQTLRGQVPQLAKGPVRRTVDEQAEYDGIIHAVYSGSGGQQQRRHLQQQLTGSSSQTSRSCAALDEEPSMPTSPGLAATPALPEARYSTSGNSTGGDASALLPLHLKQQELQDVHVMQVLHGQDHPLQVQQQQQQQKEQREEQLSRPQTWSPRRQQHQQNVLQQQQHLEELPSPKHWSPRRRQQQLEDEQLAPNCSEQHRQMHIRYEDEDYAMQLSIHQVPGSSRESDMCQRDCFAWAGPRF